MWDRDHTPFAVVGPTVIGADQIALLDIAEREFDLAMRAPVFDCSDLPVFSAEQRDRTVPELYFDDLAGFEDVIVLDGVPVVRIQSGRPRLLAQRSCFTENRRLHHATRKREFTARAASQAM